MLKQPKNKTAAASGQQVADVATFSRVHSGVLKRKTHNELTNKLSIKSLFNCHNIHTFLSTVVTYMDIRGYSPSYFFVCKVENVTFITKLIIYKKAIRELYNVNDIVPSVARKIGGQNLKLMHQADAEIQILEVFRDLFIYKDITPCLLEMIYYKICSNELPITERECQSLMKQYTKNSTFSQVQNVEFTFCELANQIRAGIASNKYAFIVMEKCNYTLRAFLVKILISPLGVDIVKSLLFQLIYTLYCIKKVFPKFQHHDLHVDNVMIKVDPDYQFLNDRPTYLSFIVGDKQYNSPYFGFIVKIIDFGFSTIPELGFVSDIVVDKNIMYNRFDNDLHITFKYINDIAHGTPVYTHIDDLLIRIEPSQVYKIPSTQYAREYIKETRTYAAMIDSGVFDDYLITVAPENIKLKCGEGLDAVVELAKKKFI